MELVLVRHGEPAHEEPGARSTDPGLGAKGCHQARRVARFLAADGVEHLYCSTQRRARETAAVVAEHTGLSAVEDERLVEFDQGSAYQPFDGSAAARDAYAGYLRGDLSTWGTDAATFRARIRAGLGDVVARHPGQRVVVVTHGGVINVHLGEVLGLDRLHLHDPAYCSVARFRVSRSGVSTLVSVNETQHLR